MNSKSYPKWPIKIKLNSYHKVVVQVQPMKPSSLSRINKIRKNFIITAQHFKRCISEEHGLSGHLDIKIATMKDIASGAITM